METQGAGTMVGSEPQTLPRSNFQHPAPTVFIVSDVRLLREGLVLSLSHQPALAVADSADLAISPTHIAAARPDVVLLDVRAPGGLETLLVLRQALPYLKIVAIAVSDIEQEVVACAEAGVSGFVSSDASIQDLVTAVHCAMRNELVCSPRVAGMLFRRVAAIGSERSHGPDNGALTRREHEIVSLMTQGLSNKEIARQLRIQNATVKNHIHSILAKLHVRRRGQVAACMRGSTLLSRSVPPSSSAWLGTTRSPGWTRSKALELPGLPSSFANEPVKCGPGLDMSAGAPD
jgi:two-component system, NarL family, nitrate/nitrite response regulator NarL